MKLFHLYLEGGPAPPMTSNICVFHLGISLVTALDQCEGIRSIPAPAGEPQ